MDVRLRPSPSSLLPLRPSLTLGLIFALSLPLGQPALVAQEPLVTTLRGELSVRDDHVGGEEIAELALTPTFRADRWIRATHTIELSLSRPLLPQEGRLAVFIGETDFTGLFNFTRDRITYRPSAFLLPRGERELVVYLVGPGEEWRELARFPLRVLGEGGSEQARVDAKLDANLNGQVAEDHRPAQNRPPRETYQDLTLHTGLQTTHVRSGWTFQTQANFVGVTNEEQALRFRQQQERAPQFDLSDYLLHVEKGIVSASMGHISQGFQRHLMSSFGSRGLSAGLRLGPVGHLSAAMMNGTSVVGWDNIAGVSRSQHRVALASLGLELLPRRPGVLRLEGMAMDGSLLPLTDFTQGEVNDAEESRGIGVRLAAELLSRRFRLDAGYARSRFTNPEDPTLSQGAALLPARRASRNARYADVSLAILRNVPLGGSWQTNVTAGYRHERVDPLYRSVTAQARADLLQHIYELTWTLGQITVGFAHTRSNDNLAKIPTILKTFTRNNSLNVALPTSSLLTGSGSHWWAPNLSYAYGGTHQFGDGVPPNSGFAESHVPNQMSKNHTWAAQWQGNRWRAEYRANRTIQDNRQPGRERADFATLVHGIGLGVTPVGALDLTGEISLESADNQELDEQSSTRRLGFNVDWRFTRTSTAKGYVSVTRRDDGVTPGATRNTEAYLGLTQGLRFLRVGTHPMPGQLFLRYARQSVRPAGVAGADGSPRTWTINTGLTLNFF